MGNVWKKMSDDIDLRLMNPFYQVHFLDGKVFNYTGNHELMIKEIEKFSPKDVAGYKRFLQEAEKCYRLGFVDLSAIAFTKLWTLIKVLPNMYSHASLGEYLYFSGKTY
jgi:phytoene desaturase